MTELFGWVATIIFASSYVLKNQQNLRRTQAAAACLWIIYGITEGAAPVVVANCLVAAMALLSARGRASSSESSVNVS